MKKHPANIKPDNSMLSEWEKTQRAKDKIKPLQAKEAKKKYRTVRIDEKTVKLIEIK